MKRRKFAILIGTFISALGLNIRPKKYMRRVLKIIKLKDVFSVDAIAEDKIASEYEEIEFKDLRMDNIFFLEDIPIKNDSKFVGPYIATDHPFPDSTGLYGIMVERVRPSLS